MKLLGLGDKLMGGTVVAIEKKGVTIQFEGRKAVASLSQVEDLVNYERGMNE